MLTKLEEIIIGNFPEEESLIPKEPEPQPEPQPTPDPTGPINDQIDDAVDEELIEKIRSIQIQLNYQE